LGNCDIVTAFEGWGNFPMDFKSTEIATISVAGIALIGSVVSAFYTYANRNRELDIKLVEIGINILHADPKGADLTPARAWAIQVIEDNSKVKFTEPDRKSLLQKPLLFRPTAGPSPASGNRTIIQDIPDNKINQTVKNLEILGATVQKTKSADGTWTVTATFP
jgi:hypothetical protein